MNARWTRRVAAGAAAGAAVLYVLIGFGVLFIGESTTGATDLLGFGLTLGGLYAIAALLVLEIRNRWFLAALVLLNLATLIGYVALAGVRVPPFELWGLAIKVLQVVMLVAVARLLFLHPEEPHLDHPPADVLSWKGSSG